MEIIPMLRDFSTKHPPMNVTPFKDDTSPPIQFYGKYPPPLGFLPQYKFPHVMLKTNPCRFVKWKKGLRNSLLHVFYISNCFLSKLVLDVTKTISVLDRGMLSKF